MTFLQAGSLSKIDLIFLNIIALIGFVGELNKIARQKRRAG